MTSATSFVPRNNAKKAREQKARAKKQEEFHQFLEHMATERREQNLRWNAHLDAQETARVARLRASLVKKGGWLFPKTYTASITSSPNGHLLFELLFSHTYTKTWSHNPTDDDLKAFAREIYGEPDYRSTQTVEPTINVLPSISIGGHAYTYDDTGALIVAPLADVAPTHASTEKT